MLMLAPKCGFLCAYCRDSYSNMNVVIQSILPTVLPVVMFSVSHGVTQIPTGDILSRQFSGNHPFLKVKLSVITPRKQPYVPW